MSLNECPRCKGLTQNQPYQAGVIDSRDLCHPCARARVAELEEGMRGALFILVNPNLNLSEAARGAENRIRTALSTIK